MKPAAFGVILICAAILTSAADNDKTIRVDETKFSDVYPAVWFSPSTGEITSLKERSEFPPEVKYEIWIEPRDPEFTYGPPKRQMGVGFALLGMGPEVWKNPKIPQGLKLNLKIDPLMMKAQAHEQLVFYCKAKTCTCLIGITSIDPKKQVVQFKWRLLKKDKGVTSKAMNGPKK